MKNEREIARIKSAILRARSQAPVLSGMQNIGKNWIMSATEIIAEFDRLPPQEQKEVFALIMEKMLANQDQNARPWSGGKFSFEKACDLMFRENHELFSRLAKLENPSL